MDDKKKIQIIVMGHINSGKSTIALEIERLLVRLKIPFTVTTMDPMDTDPNWRLDSLQMARLDVLRNKIEIELVTVQLARSK